ncbi:hypothetical protein HYALB_00012574 [Hymenoscyphus albidus]|uniref:Uncharacterized protein n=1 Tax=Hymenoscyphus albidus TaxID=595503 RepID=A0A9N9Q6M4_9HELO|nr:hypothetical protein HYALB_00012574 [Hymenoscyphus albidus]
MNGIIVLELTNNGINERKDARGCANASDSDQSTAEGNKDSDVTSDFDTARFGFSSCQKRIGAGQRHRRPFDFYCTYIGAVLNKIRSDKTVRRGGLVVLEEKPPLALPTPFPLRYHTLLSLRFTVEIIRM